VSSAFRSFPLGSDPEDGLPKGSVFDAFRGGWNRSSPEVVPPLEALLPFEAVLPLEAMLPFEAAVPFEVTVPFEVASEFEADRFEASAG